MSGWDWTREALSEEWIPHEVFERGELEPPRPFPEDRELEELSHEFRTWLEEFLEKLKRNGHYELYLDDVHRLVNIVVRILTTAGNKLLKATKREQ